jgi:hypothetical protein
MFPTLLLLFSVAVLLAQPDRIPAALGEERLEGLHSERISKRQSTD